tara:strand:- start:848 stop:1102 length:255 start_codon:yes stop_codon:yes gene_type:complete
MNDVELVEVDRQEYAGNNCLFSTGLVFGHEYETIYLRLEKDGDGPHTILMRTDEAARISAMLSNAVWSSLMKEILDADDDNALS